MSSSPNQLPIGQVIGSRYRIQSLIGRGGMGLVFSATHELTGRRVALKLMLSDSEESPVLHERFLTEARTAAAVRHPNIVDVLDMGLHDGAPYLVMELIEGVPLERLLHAQTHLSVEQTLSWLFPIVGALAVLHDAGIVHRDVKPSNIILSTVPRQPMRPKLLDFGLARVVSDLRLTRSGTVIGTPLYMAPEHAAGMSTGPQADVWSVGVVLYECLTGRSPFNYTDRSSLAAQVLAGLVEPLSLARPDLPELLSVVIGRALQRDLSRRYPDMRSFAQGLLAAATASGIRVPADPDPIGLPDYAGWLSGRGAAQVTWGQTVPPLVPAPESAPTDPMLVRTPRLGESDVGAGPSRSSSHTPLGLLSEPGGITASGTDESFTGRGRTSRSRWTLGALTLLLAVGASAAIWRFVQPEAGKSASAVVEGVPSADLPRSSSASALPSPASTPSGPIAPAPAVAAPEQVTTPSNEGAEHPAGEEAQARKSVRPEPTRAGRPARGKRTAGERAGSAKPVGAAMQKSPSAKQEEEVEAEWK